MKQKMEKFLSERLIHRRWLVMIFICALVIFSETLEHFAIGESLLNYHYLSEVFIYGMVIPIFGALLLVRLENAEAGRDAATSDLSDVHRFGQQLRNAGNWDELAMRIVELPGTLIPDVLSSRLYHFDAGSGRFLQAAAAGCTVSIPANPEYAACLYDHCFSETNHGYTLIQLHICPVLANGLPVAGQTRYCLPLVYRDQLKGLLHFSLPKDKIVSASQAQALSRLGTESAMAVENAHLQKLLDDRNTAAVRERQRIARDLHDTLGQNITYLRFKLDQLSSQHNILGDIASIQHELECMRDVANSAYESVRSRLAELQPATHPDLEPALRVLAEDYSGRMKCAIKFSSRGQPFRLKPTVQRQLLFICREAFNNIEKHAGAENVEMALDWMDNELIVQIQDDGMGFSPGDVDSPGHWGLDIMTERASGINARVEIASAPGNGACITVRLPASRPAINLTRTPQRIASDSR